MLAWDQFIRSDYVGRVPIERKLARVPAPRVFAESQKACYKRMSQSITDHRSQKRETERRERRERTRDLCKQNEERKKKTQITETRNLHGVDIVATNVTAATVPKSSVTTSRRPSKEGQGKKEREADRKGKERDERKKERKKRERQRERESEGESETRRNREKREKERDERERERNTDERMTRWQSERESERAKEKKDR